MAMPPATLIMLFGGLSVVGVHCKHKQLHGEKTKKYVAKKRAEKRRDLFLEVNVSSV